MKRTLSCLCLLPLAATVASPGWGEDFDRISRRQVGNRFIYRIERPDVRHVQTDYPHVWYKPGDTIEVRAGGCVQTGGTGKTWKRYVKPLGPNSETLYSGTIWIPPFTAGLVRIEQVLGKVLVVPSTSTANQESPLYLRLGYQDDDYGDNGYWGHDDGTQDQCKGVGPAWVEVTITPGSGKPVPTPNHPSTSYPPLELVWDATDPNLLPLNPKWGWQLTRHPNAPDYFPKPPQVCPGIRKEPPQVAGCTTQALYTDSATLCAAAGDHVNWGAATYEGRVEWYAFDDNDDDYNLMLEREDGAGATAAYGGRLKLEFDSDETIDHFKTSWWSSLHSAVDQGKGSAIIPGNPAIVTGLMGLDCAHDECWSELHPVWALAVKVTAGPSEERWAMFVRNWGNEGFCSSNQHYLPLPQASADTYRYTFRIPWRAGATSVQVTGSKFLTNSSSVAGPSVHPVAGKDVFVSFTLPRPEEGARVNGVLDLRWSGSASAATGQIALQPHQIGFLRPPVRYSIRTAEHDFEELLAGLQPNLRRTVESELRRDRQPNYSLDEMPVRTAKPGQGGASLTQVQLPPGTRILRWRWAPDAAKIDRDRRAMEALGRAGVQLAAHGPPPLAHVDPIPGAAPPPAAVTPHIAATIKPTISLEPNSDRPGHDYRDFDLAQPRPELCRDACLKDRGCLAYTYVKPGVQGANARCWLKNAAAPAQRAPCCVSGAKE